MVKSLGEITATPTRAKDAGTVVKSYVATCAQFPYIPSASDTLWKKLDARRDGRVRTIHATNAVASLQPSAVYCFDASVALAPIVKTIYLKVLRS